MNTNISLGARLRHAWNAFTARDPTEHSFYYGSGNYYRPDRARFTRGNERTVVTSVYNRIALDVAAITIQHVRLDDNGRFKDVINSGLNYCLTTEANIDQSGRAFIQDAVMSLLDEGCIAIVPVETTDDPYISGGYDIRSLRVGKILEWYPAHVKVRLYNERTGYKEDITVPKKTAAIVENPLYAVINEPNSTMQRLIRKLAILDAIDEQSGSGKLDLIIQLPYVIKSQTKREEAERRRKDIEDQLYGSKYGVAYTDGTERITQLNRPIENNLMKQIEYLTSMLYSQLGICREILDGTADDKVMTNYFNRSIEPFIAAVTDEMNRKFLTKTARSQNQAIRYFRDPFKLVSVTEIAEIADKFTRNEIMSTNELRPIIGMKPVDDPKADELRNKNISQANGADAPSTTQHIKKEENQNGEDI
ncbi:MAG: phage portal protein [Ruminococcus sp.]|nr:phage portal protein [Ruminococcus sp.]